MELPPAKHQGRTLRAVGADMHPGVSRNGAGLEGAALDVVLLSRCGGNQPMFNPDKPKCKGSAWIRN